MPKTKTSSKPAQLKMKIRIPHVILDVRGADPRLLEELAGGLEEMDARFRILGPGLKNFPQAFSMEEALEEAHMWVVLGSKLPKEFSMIVDRGIVPILLTGLHPDAENYSAVEETGNCFLFQKLSAWHVYGTLVRALENFTFSYDWENLRDQGRCLIKLD